MADLAGTREPRGPPSPHRHCRGEVHPPVTRRPLLRFSRLHRSSTFRCGRRRGLQSTTPSSTPLTPPIDRGKLPNKLARLSDHHPGHGRRRKYTQSRCILQVCQFSGRASHHACSCAPQIPPAKVRPAVLVELPKSSVQLASCIYHLPPPPRYAAPLGSKCYLR